MREASSVTRRVHRGLLDEADLAYFEPCRGLRRSWPAGQPSPWRTRSRTIHDATYRCPKPVPRCSSPSECVGDRRRPHPRPRHRAARRRRRGQSRQPRDEQRRRPSPFRGVGRRSAHPAQRAYDVAATLAAVGRMPVPTTYERPCATRSRTAGVRISAEVLPGGRYPRVLGLSCATSSRALVRSEPAGGSVYREGPCATLSSWNGPRVRFLHVPRRPRLPFENTTMAKKDNRVMVTMACTECKRRNYNTFKNKQTRTNGSS